MKKTGSLLKEKRESSGLSISEVALATKINPKILTAIENGDEANLPAKTFLKGFVRSYAIFLKMNVDEVLQSYLEEMGPQTPERQHEAYRTDTPPTTGRRSVDDENSSGMRTMAVVAIVILIGMIIGVRELIEKYQREKVVEKAENIKVSPLPVLPDTQTNAEDAANDKDGTDDRGDTKSEDSPKTSVLEKPAPAMAAAPPPPTKVEPKPEPKPPEPKAEQKPPPKPEPGKPPEPKPPEPKAEAKVDTKPEPKPQAKPTKAVNSTIILEALDKVEVKFQVKGEWKKISLAPTEVHTIRAEQVTVFEFSDGGSVNIIVDGHERGPPGELGKPKQVSLP